MSAVFEPVNRSPVTRRERRLRLPAAAVDRDFAAPAQPETGQRRPESPEIPANALLAQLVEHFHGKEGVVGSSPTEGLSPTEGSRFSAAQGHLLVSGVDVRDVFAPSISRPRAQEGAWFGRGLPAITGVCFLVDPFPFPSTRSATPSERAGPVARARPVMSWLIGCPRRCS